MFREGGRFGMIREPEDLPDTKIQITPRVIGRLERLPASKNG
jgi:hypothetical protein